jgi:hypothetical protein
MIDKYYKFYISTSERATGGKPYPGEEGPYASCEPTYKETNFIRAYATPPKNMMFYESIDLSESEYLHLSKKKLVYLAVIFYSDGDTFGTTYGLFQIAGIAATPAGAKRLNKKALEEDAYKPWEGYFSNLMSTEIFLLELVK